MAYKDPEKQRKFQRDWVAKKKQESTAFAVLVVERRRHGKEMRVNLAAEMKHELRCFFCKEDDPDRLDFHHLDPTKKFMAVSQMVRARYSLAKIVDEFIKCVVVCKNHHADLTSLRADFVSTRKRTKEVSRDTVERDKRRRQLLVAKMYLRTNHPNILFRDDRNKLLKFYSRL